MSRCRFLHDYGVGVAPLDVVVAGIKHEWDPTLGEQGAESRHAFGAKLIVEHRGREPVGSVGGLGQRSRLQNLCSGGFKQGRHLKRDQPLILDNQNGASGERKRASHTSAPADGPDETSSA